jgi:protein O-mannosyl-transferase
MAQTHSSAHHAVQQMIMRAVIVAAALAAYSQTVFAPLRDTSQFPFVFDDQYAVIENRHVQRLWPIGQAMWAPPNNPATGRPLVSLSLAMNFSLSRAMSEDSSGLHTWSYHALNLIVHTLAGLGLFAFMHRLLSLPRLDGRHERAAPWLALVITLLWIVHPLCTESVTYISTRTESMMGMFFIWSLYCGLRAMTTHPEASMHWTWCAIACCWCSAASKEVGAVIPIVMLLMDRVFVSESFSQALRRRALLYIGLSAVWILSAALVIFGPRGASVGFSHPKVGPWTYLLTQSGVIMHYIRLAFWPWPLAVDYHDWRLARSIGEIWPSALAVLLLLGATAWGLSQARHARIRMVAFACAWFFLILAPSSSILPLATEIAAERRMYLPLIAVIALAVVAANGLLTRLAAGEARAVLGGTIALLIAALLCMLTIQRNEDYRTALALWTRTVADRPSNARARISLAAALASPEIDRPRDAYQEYQRALRIEPNNFLAHANLAALLLVLGNPQDALEHGEKAVAIAPLQWLTHRNYALALGATGQARAAERELRAALDLNPSNGETWMFLARALADQGRTSESQDAVRRANELAHQR